VNKFDRVLSILIMLQSRKIVKAQAIADRFDVSLRTVYRYIRTLEAAGVPVCSEAGVGYSLAEGYKLPPVMFSEQEAYALVAAEKFMANITDEPTADAYASALTKIKAVLRSGDRDSLERLDEAIMLRSTPNLHATAHLSELFGAVAVQRVVNMEYRKLKDTETEWREVEPVGCYYHYNRWYLIAWCRLRQDYRTFRVDRIRQLKAGEERFESNHPSLGEYIEREAQLQQSHKVEVLFSRNVADYVVNDQYTYGLVQREDQGEWVKMTFLVSNYHLIARWLLMYTTHARVVGPDELKEVMRGIVQTLKENYLG